MTWLGTVEAISPSTEILSALAKRLTVKWIRVAAYSYPQCVFRGLRVMELAGRRRSRQV